METAEKPTGQKKNITPERKESLVKAKLQRTETAARLFDSSPEGKAQKSMLQRRREEVQKNLTLKPSEIGDWKIFKVGGMSVLVPGEYNTKQNSIALGYSYNFKTGVKPVWSTDERIRGLIKETNYLGPVLISTDENLLKEIITNPPQLKGKK